MKPLRSESHRAMVVSFAVAGALLIGGVLAARHSVQVHPAGAAGQAESSKPGQVSGGGVTLVSQSLEFPDDNDGYGTDPASAVMNANCTACHSASMALNQPRLSEADWRGEVQKMRETYKATVADKDVPRIVDYLSRLSARLPPSPGARRSVAGAAAGSEP